MIGYETSESKSSHSDKMGVRESSTLSYTNRDCFIGFGNVEPAFVFPEKTLTAVVL